MTDFERIIAANYTQRESDDTEIRVHENISTDLASEVYSYLRGGIA